LSLRICIGGCREWYLLERKQCKSRLVSVWYLSDRAQCNNG
jgi:hypothetical protein